MQEVKRARAEAERLGKRGAWVLRPGAVADREPGRQVREPGSRGGAREERRGGYEAGGSVVL